MLSANYSSLMTMRDLGGSPRYQVCARRRTRGTRSSEPRTRGAWFATSRADLVMTEAVSWKTEPRAGRHLTSTLGSWYIPIYRPRSWYTAYRPIFDDATLRPPRPVATGLRALGAVSALRPVRRGRGSWHVLLLLARMTIRVHIRAYTAGAYYIQPRAPAVATRPRTRCQTALAYPMRVAPAAPSPCLPVRTCEAPPQR